MKIEKKCWPDSFNKILSGEKTYELRLGDFECKSGDVLVLKEWDPETKDYTGRVIEKKVGHVGMVSGNLYWKQEDIEKYGFQIISLR
ncbi:MAG: DUF3850 domain-containing protein [Nanoarchaeota archaeon]